MFSYSSRILDGAAIRMSHYILIVVEYLRDFLDGLQIKDYREDLLIISCDSLQFVGGQVKIQFQRIRPRNQG